MVIVIHYSFFIHIKSLFGAYVLSEKHTYTRKKHWITFSALTKKNGKKNTEPGSSILSLQKHSDLLIAYKPLKKVNEENRIEQPPTTIVIQEQIFS